jgi:Sulfotransferase family
VNQAPVPGPNVIGATGGSGTRVIASIVRSAGMFIGSELNAYEDAVDFGRYSDRWINTYVAARQAPPPEVASAMAAELDDLVADHRSTMPADARRWGWKEPRSIYLLPFFDGHFDDLRFLHVVRDGRDMAFSDNQQQLMKHGSAVLEGRVSRRRPLRSIALWNKVNLMAADYGERVLGPRYLLLRFEDLCDEPERTIGRAFDFLGLEGDPQAAAAEVHAPKGLGRWRSRRKGLLRALEQQAEPALRRFGYA